MSCYQTTLNRTWCRILIEELSRLGVTDVCIAPGSRSTPLTLEADGNPALLVHSHFDERGLGFYALGLAKASDRPVAIIVTSGTAVANLLPAVVEAGLTNEKLVVLTADRPVELIACGANQAIHQSGIFSSHVKQSLLLPSPNQSYPWLLSTLDHTMFQQQEFGGALHINCPFPEPFYGEAAVEAMLQEHPELSMWLENDQPFCRIEQREVSATLDWSLAYKRGILVLGRLTPHQAIAAKRVADRLGWPVLADPQSGVSSNWRHYDLWLQTDKGKKAFRGCECVVQLGDRLVSKRLNQWVSKQVSEFGASYKVVSETHQQINPDHLPQHRLIASIDSWLALLNECVEVDRKPWCDFDFQWHIDVQYLVEKYSTSEPVTELAVARWLTTQQQTSDVFIGNSLIVRLVDMVGLPAGLSVYTNRGASGIDGLVATMAGVSACLSRPVLMVLGDTSLLHDLNSLALLSKSDVANVVLVTNNDGGAIFDLLPVPKQQKSNLYQMPHGFDFAHAAAQFKLKYQHIEAMPELQAQVKQHIEHGKGTLLIEVTTPPNQASTQIRTLVQALNAL
ncbi:2-succinyl-5-enolpyruvyl-6-hydroxy-3-cyclohexene-1-carboxylic-acid synthase [Vibrio sp. FNV 38]|nr:2-succinyl-5-enolpyruvyl-6-hydroxy-3-cyclohexene-1-carboxylic-acid synthase [Vibrio sp. FNV 38]